MKKVTVTGRGATPKLIIVDISSLFTQINGYNPGFPSRPIYEELLAAGSERCCNMADVSLGHPGDPGETLPEQTSFQNQ